MQPGELHKVKPPTLLRFARATEVFVTFGCTGDVQWADCTNGLSTEWLTPASAEEWRRR